MTATLQIQCIRSNMSTQHSKWQTSSHMDHSQETHGHRRHCWSKILTHTTFTQSNLSVSSAVVNPLFSNISKRARESFAASASAKQKPVHCAAMIARMTNEKNAGLDYHAVPPPGYKARGDSEREELCQQDPQQFTVTTTGASSSSGRLEATGDPSSSGEGKVHPQATP